MKGPRFHVVDHYDALVRRSVSTKTMTVQAGKHNSKLRSESSLPTHAFSAVFVEDLFPESAMKKGKGGGWEWR